MCNILSLPNPHVEKRIQPKDFSTDSSRALHRRSRLAAACTACAVLTRAGPTTQMPCAAAPSLPMAVRR